MRTLRLIFLVFIISSLTVTQFSAQEFTLTIWVDKGCGGEYFVGDMLTVNWSVTHNCEITFWEIEPDGFKRKLHSGPIISSSGQGSRGWTLKDYGYGKRSIYAEAVSLWGMDSAQCEYYVLKRAADIDVKVEDQDGQPISGVSVLMDGSAVASTGASGTVTIPEAEFGEHTITASFEGEEQSSRIRIASTQTQHLDFVFTVEKMGSIQVRVFDQGGAPVGDVDVYIDGYKEGRTSSNGVFTTSASEGDHFVEVRWQNERAEESVTVVKNQTSFADLTIYIVGDAFIAVFVQDTAGTPVSNANVYLDTIFLGKTDDQGNVREKVAPGPHTVRVEKQGYESATSTTDVREGDTAVTVVLTPEEGEVPVYSILTVLGILYMLKRRH